MFSENKLNHLTLKIKSSTVQIVLLQNVNSGNPSNMLYESHVSINISEKRKLYKSRFMQENVKQKSWINGMCITVTTA